MDRERLRVVLVGVLCVLAVSAAAATLSAPEETRADTGGGSLQADDEDREQGEGGESNADPIGSPGELDFDIGACIPWLYSGWFWLVVAAVATGIWLLARHHQDSLAATAYVSALAMPFSLVWLLLSKCGADPNEEQSIVPSDLVVTPDGGDAAFGVLGEAGRAASPVWLVAVVALVGLGALAVAVTRTPADADEPDDSTPAAVDPDEHEDVDDLRAAAGRAADRIERAAAVDNEIYRAWVEMTEYLDVEHPESSTPREFEAAAVDAGIEPDTVAELTALFERVRYGDQPPTEAAEARAVDALRSMETAATDLDDVWGDDDSDDDVSGEHSQSSE
ncbi:DUF4129 domain-containing protein [Halorubellus sp. JP-L1]|uniref:DUF4129 domain-containing protein n=1 Tax=Halorubellus sp. JP-L1 TaxID=2715753 RepID=UPI00140A0596|nr:DUF4129 domain-containing protein [Halorubellus sp. JP-L1]NHN42226.1 DUF4129 domain-containing protein [Halorubellus sp. JP-L1]